GQQALPTEQAEVILQLVPQGRVLVRVGVEERERPRAAGHRGAGTEASGNGCLPSSISGCWRYPIAAAVISGTRLSTYLASSRISRYPLRSRSAAPVVRASSTAAVK